MMVLEERRNMFDMLVIFRVLKGLSVIPVETFFEWNRNDKTKGHPLKITK